MNNDGIYIQNKYKLIKKIGEGSYSNVYLAENIYKNTKVAIKFEKENDEKSRKLLENEVSVYLYLLKYDATKNINIKSFGIYEKVNYIIMDYLYMDLQQYFDKNRNTITIDRVNVLLNNVFILLTNMHKTGIIYRDVKPDNFLFDKKNDLCIIDLGLSTNYNEHNKLKNLVGTPLYSSFNTHKEEYVYEKKDDIISVYFMFFHLITNKLPWSDLNYLNDDTKNIIMFFMKKDSIFNKFYKVNEINESEDIMKETDYIMLNLIKSYNNFIQNNKIQFYS